MYEGPKLTIAQARLEQDRLRELLQADDPHTLAVHLLMGGNATEGDRAHVTVNGRQAITPMRVER